MAVVEHMIRDYRSLFSQRKRGRSLFAPGDDADGTAAPAVVAAERAERIPSAAVQPRQPQPLSKLHVSPDAFLNEQTRLCCNDMRKSAEDHAQACSSTNISHDCNVSNEGPAPVFQVAGSSGGSPTGMRCRIPTSASSGAGGQSSLDVEPTGSRHPGAASPGPAGPVSPFASPRALPDPGPAAEWDELLSDTADGELEVLVSQMMLSSTARLFEGGVDAAAGPRCAEAALPAHAAVSFPSWSGAPCLAGVVTLRRVSQSRAERKRRWLRCMRNYRSNVLNA